MYVHPGHVSIGVKVKDGAGARQRRIFIYLLFNDGKIAKLYNLHTLMFDLSCVKLYITYTDYVYF